MVRVASGLQLPVSGRLMSTHVYEFCNSFQEKNTAKKRAVLSSEAVNAKCRHASGILRVSELYYTRHARVDITHNMAQIDRTDPPSRDSDGRQLARANWWCTLFHNVILLPGTFIVLGVLGRTEGEERQLLLLQIVTCWR